MADALASGASVRKDVGVQVPPRPPPWQHAPMLSELASAVREGRVHPTELVEEALRRIDKHNGPINAVVTLGAEQALDDARRSPREGPLGGIPFLVKDLARCIGLPTSYGSPLTAAALPRRSTTRPSPGFAVGGAIRSASRTRPRYGWTGPRPTPSSVRRTTRGTSSARPEVRAAGRPRHSLQGSCRSPPRRTAADRCASPVDVRARWPQADHRRSGAGRRAALDRLLGMGRDRPQRRRRAARDFRLPRADGRRRSLAPRRRHRHDAPLVRSGCCCVARCAPRSTCDRGGDATDRDDARRARLPRRGDREPGTGASLDGA